MEALDLVFKQISITGFIIVLIIRLLIPDQNTLDEIYFCMSMIAILVATEFAYYFDIKIFIILLDILYSMYYFKTEKIYFIIHIMQILFIIYEK